MVGLYVLGIAFAWLARPNAKASAKQIPAKST
jgi:hypothetical protein